MPTRERGTIRSILVAACLAAGLTTACGARADRDRAPIVLATTTSTQDSGLLDVLIPPFESTGGWTVKTIAVGSGKALALAERGEADLVLAHSEKAEREFMDRGGGAARWRLMYNDFILLGPPADPAGARGAGSVIAALRAIVDTGAPFVSRADESGTHLLERSLWEQLGIAPGAALIETGQGMGATLRVASERHAYTIADRSTWLAQRAGLGLEVLQAGDPVLRNVYHIILVDPRRGPRVNTEGARALARYLLSRESLERIAGFGRDRFGEPLFTPDPDPAATQ
jgi:tungstate transport system substrate-binding protein